MCMYNFAKLMEVTSLIWPTVPALITNNSPNTRGYIKDAYPKFVGNENNNWFGGPDNGVGRILQRIVAMV